MLRNSGAVVNPYKRMLLKRRKNVTSASPITGDTAKATTETVEVSDSDDITINKAGLSKKESDEVTTIINRIDKPLVTTEAKIENTIEVEDPIVSTEPVFKIIEKTSGLIKGLSEKAQNILNQVLSGSKGDVFLTSGFRTAEENLTAGLNGAPGNPNSFHLTGDAMDFRPSDALDTFLTSSEGLAQLASLGYEVVDERNKKDYAPHWHLEPAPKQKFFKGGLIYKYG